MVSVIVVGTKKHPALATIYDVSKGAIHFTRCDESIQGLLYVAGKKICEIKATRIRPSSHEELRARCLSAAAALGNTFFNPNKDSLFPDTHTTCKVGDSRVNIKSQRAGRCLVARNIECATWPHFYTLK